MYKDNYEQRMEEFVKYKRTLADEFVENQIKAFPDANEKVLYFIIDFYYHSAPLDCNLQDYCENIRRQYRAGYCYYFANMLKAAFNRGEICWASPFSHIVWVDEDDIAYDIEGVHNSECNYYIPIRYLGDTIKGFKHIRGLEYITTKEELTKIVQQYEKDMGYENNTTNYFK